MTEDANASGWLAELHRRNVPRVALIYSGVAWTLLQVADLAFPRLGLPDWSVTLVLGVVALGFPVALALAWTYEIGPEGIIRDAGARADAVRTARGRMWFELVLIAIIAIAVGWLYVEHLALERALEANTPRGKGQRSIAVLAFDDMSEQRDQAWFAEGMAEELLNALSRIGSLRVMARTSSFAFKDSNKTVAEIATALAVDTVLQGSVRRAGDRVRISAQLVDARAGHQLWSDTFERKADDIFALQDELAHAIVDALKVELGVAPETPLVSGTTRNLEAYNWFLRGRAAFDWSNPARLNEVIAHFQRAVESDPGYAQAWGYLAFATMISPALGADDLEAVAAADAAVARALAIDPEQSEALAVSALIAQLRDHDWVRAGALYRRALAAPDRSNATAIYAVMFLPQLGRFDEAFALYADAESRDPLHAGIKTNLGVTLRFAGRTDEAIAKLEEAIALSPMHVFAWSNLILTYLGKGDLAGADALLARIPEPLRAIPNIRQRIGQVHARRGDPRATAILDELLADETKLRGRLGLVAGLACDLERDEQCLSLLEQAGESVSWTKLFAFEAIGLDSPLQSHPRFRAALRRIGLDPEAIAATNGALDAAGREAATPPG